jgi:hypothetical protein
MSAVIAVEEFPSYSDEVKRKAYDTLSMLVTGFENKVIGASEFLVCMDTLSYAYGGLIETEFMQLVDAFRDKVKDASQASQMKLFYRVTDNSTVALLGNTDKLVFKVMRINSGSLPKITVKQFGSEEDPIKAITIAFNKMSVSLVALGFDEFV